MRGRKSSGWDVEARERIVRTSKSAAVHRKGRALIDCFAVISGAQPNLVHFNNSATMSKMTKSLPNYRPYSSVKASQMRLPAMCNSTMLTPRQKVIDITEIVLEAAQPAFFAGRAVPGPRVDAELAMPACVRIPAGDAHLTLLYIMALDAPLFNTR